MSIGLAPLDLSRALVVCDNGAAMSTRNSGKTWRQVARIPNTLAITAGSGRYWVAGAHEGCDGVTVQSLTEKSGSLTRGRTRCAPGLDVAAGQVAIDVTGDGTIWLWSGSRVVDLKGRWPDMEMTAVVLVDLGTSARSCTTVREWASNRFWGTVGQPVGSEQLPPRGGEVTSTVAIVASTQHRFTDFRSTVAATKTAVPAVLGMGM